jgi:putative Holliday junction resolvase
MSVREERILAIDYGFKKIGMALSDPLCLIASPLPSISTEMRLEATVSKAFLEIKKHKLKKIVIGMPYRMNGKQGILSDEVEHFTKLLAEMTDIPLQSWDQRLVSVQAQRSLRQTKLSSKRQKQAKEIVSAQVLLQNYLDSLCGEYNETLVNQI